MKSADPPNRFSYFLVFLIFGIVLIPLAGGSLVNGVASLPNNLVAILGSIFHGTDSPVASHFAIALPFLLTAFLYFSKSRVVPFPSARIVIPIQAFFVVVLLSIGESHFLSNSILAAIQFFTYGIAFFTVLSVSGRYKGPKVLLQTLIGAITFVALAGIEEWVQAKASDPSWRIFANWMNPNALAIILAVGFVLALAEIIELERVGRLAMTVAASLIALALFLTQSRGGLLACVFGVVAAILVLAIKTKSIPMRQVLSIVPTIILAGLFVFAAIHSVSQGSIEPGQRLVTSSSATGQSSAFRLNLWKGSEKVIKKHPTGTGIGTYVYYSAESGLTTQTFLAHSNYVQLAVETSLLGVALFLAFVINSVLICLKGKWSDPKRAIRLAFVLGAVVTMLIDGLLESDLYFFGSGLLFFVLIALALVLAPDGESPEVNLPVMKKSIPFAAAIVAAGLLYFAIPDTLTNLGRNQLSNNQPLKAITSAKTALSICPFWEPAIQLQIDLSATLDQRRSLLADAVQSSPSSKNYRMLGETYSHQGKLQTAIKYFNQALILDPSSLLTLNKLLQAQVGLRDSDGAKSTALKMISIENEPYFKIRAISEVVPLYTVDARTYLASETDVANQKINYLKGAIKLENDYLSITVPNLKDFVKKYGSSAKMDGESIAEAIQKLEAGEQIAQKLITIATQSKDSISAQWASEELAKFESGVADLRLLDSGNK